MAGAAMVAAAVLLAGGLPMGMFVAGSFTSAVIAGCGVGIIGLGRLGRFMLAFESALCAARAAKPRHVANLRSSVAVVRAASHSQRAETPVRHETAETHKPNVVAFEKSEMLRTVQQQVVSALVNLGMPFTHAQKAVIEASSHRPGLDFETLFRLCLPSQNARKASA